MKKHAIAFIPGDGFGPSLLEECRQAIDLAAEGFSLEWIEYPYSASHYARTGQMLPEEALEEMAGLDSIYLGPIGGPKDSPGFIEKSFFKKMRSYFDQFACVAPIKLYPGVPTVFGSLKPKQVDFVIVRECTEDIHMGIGGFFWGGTPCEMAVQAGVISRKASARAIKLAYSIASRQRGKRVTSCDTMGIPFHGYSLWRKVFLELSRRRRGFHPESVSIGELIGSLPSNPSGYSVIVAPNALGQVITELGFMLQGGRGMSHVAFMNPEGISAFMPSQQRSRRGHENPMSSLLAGGMMLRALGEEKAASRIDDAVQGVLKQGRHRTPDMGGKSSTAKVLQAVGRRLAR